MSNLKNLERKLSATEARWEAVQLTAANAQRELDYAVAIFEKNKDEVSSEEAANILAKIEEQREAIKNYLLRGYSVHSGTTVRLQKAIERLKAENANL